MKAYSSFKKKKYQVIYLLPNDCSVCCVCVVIHVREPAHPAMYEHAEAQGVYWASSLLPLHRLPVG